MIAPTDAGDTQPNPPDELCHIRFYESPFPKTDAEAALWPVGPPAICVAIRIGRQPFFAPLSGKAAKWSKRWRHDPSGSFR
jgi:hypothetical protein